MTKTLRGLIAATVFLSTMAMTLPAQAASATFSVSPSSGSYHTGDTVAVTIGEDSGSETVTIIQADLQYPSSVLQYTGVDASSSGFTDIAPTPTSDDGVIKISRGSINGQSGQQTVIVVKFKAIADGTANFAMANSSAIFRKSDAANLYANSTTAGAAGTSSQTSSSSTSVQSSVSNHVANSSTATSNSTPAPTKTIATKASPTPSLVQIITAKDKSVNSIPTSHVWTWLLLFVILAVIGFLAFRLWWRRRQHLFSDRLNEPNDPPASPTTPAV
jgi:hypothetical protein